MSECLGCPVGKFDSETQQVRPPLFSRSSSIVSRNLTPLIFIRTFIRDDARRRNATTAQRESIRTGPDSSLVSLAKKERSRRRTDLSRAHCVSAEEVSFKPGKAHAIFVRRDMHRRLTDRRPVRSVRRDAMQPEDHRVRTAHCLAVRRFARLAPSDRTVRRLA